MDDFYNNPEELRDFALSQYYYDDSGFEGLRTRKQFFFDGYHLVRVYDVIITIT